MARLPHFQEVGLDCLQNVWRSGPRLQRALRGAPADGAQELARLATHALTRPAAPFAPRPAQARVMRQLLPTRLRSAFSRSLISLQHRTITFCFGTVAMTR